MGIDKTWTSLLDPPSGPLSGPLNFFSEKKINLSYTQCVCYIPPPLSQFSFLQFSIQLERRCSPPCHAFPSSRLVFPRGIRNFLSNTYSDNFRRTCHFQVAWTPAILFSADQYNRGVLLAAQSKNIFRVSVTKSVRPLWENTPEK